MLPTADTLRQQLECHPRPNRYWIGYSGGLDSRVLLELCARIARDDGRCSFAAVHVHHGLQAVADDWVTHCQQVCEHHALPCRIIRVDALPLRGQSPEDAARTARYRALQSVLAEGDILLTAQHRDDQAETLLLQLLRGAGLAGLAAMPDYAPLPPGHILRPFLAHTRQELAACAAALQLDWIEDPSNQDQTYDRNFLRQSVWPLLESRWPGLSATLTRTARHCAEAQAMLDQRAAAWLAPALRGGDTRLDLTVLRRHPSSEQALILRAWLKHNGLRMISTRCLAQLQQTVIAAGADRTPHLVWPEAEIRRYRDTLYLLNPPLRPVRPVWLDWPGDASLSLPDDNGQLEVTRTCGSGIALRHWQGAAIRVGYRRGGESIGLPGRHHRHALKKFLQEQGVPPWMRERLPLIYLDSQLASIAGRWTLAAHAASPDEDSVQIHWRQP